MKRTEHHQRIHISKSRMVERQRQTAYDLKAEGLPERHSPSVGADDKVELHTAIAAQLGVIQRVPTHGASDPAPRRSGARHVAAIANVLAATGLIGANIIGADDLPIFLGDEGFPLVSKPIGKSISFRHVPLQCIGFASTDRRADDLPNRWGIVHVRRADVHARQHLTK